MISSRVTAIVLNYNGRDTTARCLEALMASVPRPTILVVDNASTDDSLAFLQGQYPALTFLSNTHNLGFAGGMNTGLRYALAHEGDYFWLINNDAVVAPDACGKMLAVAEGHNGECLLSPAIYTLDKKKTWFLAGHISYLRMRGEHIFPMIKNAEALPSEFLTGCALLLPRKVIELIGLLDEHYFLYYEDVAYSVAAHRARFLVATVPGAHVFHTEQSQMNSEKVYWLVRSAIHFFRANTPWYGRPWIEGVLLARQGYNRLKLLFSPDPLAREVRRAYTDASYD